MRNDLRAAGAYGVNDKCDRGSREQPNEGARCRNAAPNSEPIIAKYASSRLSRPECAAYRNPKEYIWPRELRREMAQRTYREKTHQYRNCWRVHRIKSPPGPLRYDVTPAPERRASLRLPVSGR